MATRYEVVHEQDAFFFQLRTDDGEVVLRSLGSPSKIMTQNEILHLRDAVRDESRRVRHRAGDGSHFLVLKDRDGSVLAKSPRVESDDELQRLIDRVLAAGSAPIIDLTRATRSRAS